jgi:hypothetical protein
MLTTVGMVISPIGAGAGAAPAVGPGRSLDLKVLVISVGDRTTDPGLELMARNFEQFGVPYDVLDSSTTTLTDAMLATGLRGHYNGIIVTQADLFTPSGSGFSPEEWQRLHAYERDFGVREAVIAGFPATDPGHDLDYGMANVGVQVTAQGRWVSPAGTGRMFSYVNTANTIGIPEFSFWGVPRNNGTGPHITPLLVDDADPTHALVSQLDYPDGRQVLLSTVGNAWFRLHSNVLAYQFLDFATKGVFIGGRFVSLSTHTDDMFLADDLWDPVTKQTDETRSYRMSPADMDNLVTQQAAFRTAHPLASTWKVQFPFNGVGATGWTPNPRVTRAVGSDSRLVKATSANYGRTTGIVVSKSGTAESRALFRADGSIAAPVADRLDKVVLRVNVTAASGPLAVDVCPVTQVWVEGAGNGGLLDIFDVSWNTRQTLQSWQSAGATHATAECLHRQITGVGFNELDITPIWQTWANGSRFNSGVVIKPMATGSVTVASSEATTTANRPTLGFDTSTKPEPLTAKVIEHKDQFNWINHTYAARQMDRTCPDPDEPQPPLCPVTTYDTAYQDIAKNRDVWTALGLPGYQEGLPYLLSDSHSGLQDRRGTYDNLADDIPFPTGSNPNFFQAAQALGVRFIASDSSRINQDKEQRVPDFPDLVLLPRYPTNIYVNTTTPEENIDEYNWIYHDRYVAMGQDPCAVVGALCSPRTYQQMLDSEADTTVNHMLSGKTWPHYFHQSNLRDYGSGKTLQLDWMSAVMNRYEQLFTLPVKTPLAQDLGPDALDRIVVREQNVRGWIDLDTNVVTLQADGTAHPLVTGLVGGELYGGQTIGKVTVGTTPTTYAVDPSAAG